MRISLLICFVAALFPFAVKAQQHQLIKLWQTDTVVAIPESVLPDFKKNILYVSLIDGGGWDVDGKGGVAILQADGKNYNPNWITGLNAPKGLGRIGDKIYTADISEIVVIDIKKGRIEKKIKIDSAKGLNDITTDDKGVVYVSDSKTGKVHRIEKDVPSVYLENMKGANGLKVVNNDLYVLANKAILKVDAAKNITKLCDFNSGDGIEPVGNGDFIVTEWAGLIYYVYANGNKELLLDTRAEKKNTADIGYDPDKKIVYVPTFNGKIVAAYQLK
jgi:hypothetical protein